MRMPLALTLRGISCACPLNREDCPSQGGPDMAEINSPGGPLSAGDQILFCDRPASSFCALYY